MDALLRHLEMVDFDGAPRALGYDEQGRQVLTFVEGDVFDGLIAWMSSNGRQIASTPLASNAWHNR